MPPAQGLIKVCVPIKTGIVSTRINCTCVCPWAKENRKTNEVIKKHFITGFEDCVLLQLGELALNFIRRYELPSCTKMSAKEEIQVIANTLLADATLLISRS